LKGKLINNVSYNIRGSTRTHKVLFALNDYNENATNEDYAFGELMQVVYDDMENIEFSGDLKPFLSDNVTLNQRNFKF
jgi:hypothetical protein